MAMTPLTPPALHQLQTGCHIHGMAYMEWLHVSRMSYTGILSLHGQHMRACLNRLGQRHLQGQNE